MFLTITWKNRADLDHREGWVVQPTFRVRKGWWKHEKPVAGPFRTRAKAREVKKFLESVGWE